MGKRELLIAIVFVLIGAAAYQLTAPAPKAGERRFSFSDVFSSVRREIRSHATSATLTQTGTVALGFKVSELRITTSRGVPVTVTGEKRDDVGYEMQVESSGPDEASAREYAERTTLTKDDLGSALALGISYPEEGTQRAQLTLRVPNRLVVRVENSGRIQITGTAGADLRNAAGDTTVSNVTGEVTGSHRAGDLKVTDVGQVDLALTSSRATFRGVARSLALSVRAGECEIIESRGTAEITVNSTQLTVTEPSGPIKISGENGRVRLLQPVGEVSIDVRRALVELTLSRGVPATVITSDEPLRLMLEGPPGMTIDALATNGGSILASDFDLQPTVENRTSRLDTSMAGGGPRVVMRNSSGNIVISRRQ